MQILFEDYYLLVINKPAGLSAESGEQRHPSAEREALFYITEELNKKSTSKRLKITPYLRAAHRLDRPASGVLVFAKTKMALVELMRQFEEQQTQKVYLAVTAKRPPADSGLLQNWLKKDADGRKALVFDLDKKGRQRCDLQYVVREPRGAGALLELRPATGRFHQIRAQLAHIGCPIVGDVLYGGPAWQDNEIKLHAASLTIAHPKSGEQLTFEAPLPDNW